MITPMNTVYGISNCDTVKRARTWMDAHQVPYQFHDFKKQGVPDDALDRWLLSAGWETLLNRRGTTWRQLDEATRATVTDSASAKAVLLAHPSLIKRPVVDWETPSRLTVGFDAEIWAAF